MKTHEWALMGLMVLSTGCFQVVRSSSQTQLPEKRSHLVLTGTTDDAARRFSELFSKRGFQVTDRQKRKNGATLYVFKGQRAALTTVTGNSTVVSGSTSTVGSTFYVLLTPQGDTTKAQLFGKPTLNGSEVCSDEAPAWVPACVEDVYAGVAWDGLDQMTGREEAETLRGMMLELELAASSGPGSPVVTAEPQTSEPAPPACVASQLPEWKTASAVEKKKLLERCREESKDGAQAADSR
ncbi:MAG TPA: hypothetical protein VFZ09_24145 [Archangium sp.]|uniref:hypothetical protein n=1 Tax=Archangium sp. TaxID=1872627 RepID=UPI002E34D8E1|nr:hypothetical protein [Archangium sp.]HEX5749343.1 hypothetical protein [Archangium sp.]